MRTTVPIIIRRITVADLDSVKAVRLESLRDSPSAFGSTYQSVSQWSQSDWVRRIATLTGQKSAGYLAWDQSTPCGLAIGVEDDESASVITLISMWVAPTHRRGGVGRSLVDAVAGWAQSRQAGSLRLHVTSVNLTAIEFYERLGFARTGRVFPYPNDPAVVEFEMDRTL